MSNAKSILDYTDRVIEHYEKGTSRGVDLGFKTLSPYLSIKKGYTTYLLGFPRAGKTEFHLEILFNLTERYGWKHALMSPEIGSIEDVIGELVSKHLRSPFFKSNPYGPVERQVHQALVHLSEFFYPIDSDEEDYTVESFYERCKQIEKDQRIKLDTTSIDPWNDLNEDLMNHAGREDKYLAWALKKVRSSAKVNEWHNFVVTHARDMPPIQLKHRDGGEVSCTPVPTLQSFAGGQVWSRRAMNVIAMWKPEEGAINPVSAMPFQDNEAIVKVIKAKPKGVGKLGSTPLFFDWKTNRYYEEIDGKRRYAYEHEKDYTEVYPSQLHPSNEFDNDPIPF